MSDFLFSECSSFFSACQIGAEISRMHYAILYLNQREAKDYSTDELHQPQQDLLRLEIAAAMVCHAQRLWDLTASDQIGAGDSTHSATSIKKELFLNAPPEFFASYYHNMLGLDTYRNDDMEINTMLSEIWNSIASDPAKFYRSEIDPLFTQYSDLIPEAEQDDLQKVFSETLLDFSSDGLAYRYVLLCKTAEQITVRQLHRTVEQQGYRGIINDLDIIRRKTTGGFGCGDHGGFSGKRSICIAKVSYRSKKPSEKYYCAVSGLWDRSGLGIPWTRASKLNPLFPQEHYEINLERQLNSIIRKLPFKTTWCKTDKAIESYYDQYDQTGQYEIGNPPILPLPRPITLLSVLKIVCIQGKTYSNWKRLFSCGERKILCRLRPKISNIDCIDFYIDRPPCHICDYSLNNGMMIGVNHSIRYVP